MTPALGYYLGLPAWAFPGWRGRYFVDEPSRLASYASVFNSVEGNTTFYQIPDASTVRRWQEAVAGTEFRFALKLPRAVTHEHRPDYAALEQFLGAVAPLEPHLGPLLVQFPASLGPAELGFVETILTRLDGRYRAAVEVRHPALFAAPELLAPILERFGAARVSLDARALHHGDRSHPDVLAALHKKPDLPLLADPIGGVGFVRLVLHPDLASNDPWIDEWVGRAATWLAAGTELWMQIHCPNNLHCPPLALEFHARLQQRLSDIGSLPAWPVPQQFGLI